MGCRLVATSGVDLEVSAAGMLRSLSPRLPHRRNVIFRLVPTGLLLAAGECAERSGGLSTAGLVEPGVGSVPPPRHRSTGFSLRAGAVGAAIARLCNLVSPPGAVPAAPALSGPCLVGGFRKASRRAPAQPAHVA